MIRKLRFPMVVLLALLLVGVRVEYPSARGDVGITRVTQSTTVMNEVSSFTVEFHVGVALYANQGQSISIKWGPEFTVPDGLTTTGIIVKGTAPGAVVVTRDSTGTTLTMTIVGASVGGSSPNIQPWEPITLSIPDTAGIRNPKVWGKYGLEMWTSNEPNHISATLMITQGGGNGQSVQGLAATVNPLTAGRAGEYQLTFSVSSQGEVVGLHDDYIDVYFPAGTVLPSQPQAEDIVMNWTANCRRVEISGNRVRLWIPAETYVAQGSQCTVIILSSFGVLNPEVPGTYVLEVATSKDTTPSLSTEYQIIGTAVSEATVSAKPSSQGAVAAYSVQLRPSPSGALRHGIDRIYIDFPESYVLPSVVPSATVTVNQRPANDVRVGPGRRLAVYLPVDVQASSDVQVAFSAEAGIRNPLSAGTHILKVSTSADTLPLDCALVISPSQVGQVSVHLSSTGTGQRSAYSIDMTLGLGGRLVAGVDQIVVRFPSGTQVPGTLLAQSVLVNKVVCGVVTVSGSTVYVTVPSDLDAGSVANVAFSDGADIKNPSLPGSYTLYVSSTREASLAESAPYALVDVPVATATVTPASPDGLNGYYKTLPTVSFTATSASDPSPRVYYQVGSSLPIEFLGTPLKITDGIRSFSYFAVDSQGHQGSVGTLRLAVDTTAPAIAVTAPVEGLVVSNAALAVAGTVEPGSTLIVNGSPVDVGMDGGFTSTVVLAAGPSTVRLVAQDAAGNTSQREVHVTYDSVPPMLSVASPAEATTLYHLPLIVSGRAEAGAVVSVNGTVVQTTSDGSFSGSVDQLDVGDNTIVVVARDGAGNSTTKSIVVKYSHSRIIRMQVGNSSALVNGDSIPLASPPIVQGGTSYVPLRFIGEAFGATVNWDGVFELVDIELGATHIRLQVGRTIASVNGKRLALLTPPLLMRGVTMVPVRFVSDALGAQVVWDATTKTISLLYDQGS